MQETHMQPKLASSCSLRLIGLPALTTIGDVWGWFVQFGNISWIEIYSREERGNRLQAKLIYYSPPKELGWLYDRRLPVLKGNRTFYVKVVPYGRFSNGYITQTKTLRSLLLIAPSSIQFGRFTAKNKLAVTKHFCSDAAENSLLQIDQSSEMLTVWFKIITPSLNEHQYKFEASISSLKAVYESIDRDGVCSVTLEFPYPPHYYEKLNRPTEEQGKGRDIWSSWARITEICEDSPVLQAQPVSVYTYATDATFFDIGRANAFRFSVKPGTHQEELIYLESVLRDFNIPVCRADDLELHIDQLTMWELLDKPQQKSDESALNLLSPSYIEPTSLEFEVRYLLETCVSMGYMSEYAVDVAFLHQLASLPKTEATTLLDYVIHKELTINHPMSLFDLDPRYYQPMAAKLPRYCSAVLKVHVTPTGLRLKPPVIESSNRVLRQYGHLSDRFLRVQFLEETEKRRISDGRMPQSAIWRRLHRALHQGIKIGDRKYEFLVFGASQLKEAGAVFFCPTQFVSCDDIRNWMGDFAHITNVAKYGARLGQCFSTSREIGGLSAPVIKYSRDIEANGSCFTDGIGMISDFLARCISHDLGFNAADQPSAFQIRMGGIKGVLAVWPEAKGLEVHIRKSQEKFKATFNQLEVVRCSRFSTATLNRQTITILENLGVPKSSFMEILEENLQVYSRVMQDASSAIDALGKFVDENQATLLLAEMIHAGFITEGRQDPFVLSILKLWRAWNIKLLREKARINIEQSAFVLGVVDETGTLRGHAQDCEGCEQHDISKLPQIFLQTSNTVDSAQTKVITGVCVVGRNPSLHPGDLRVVEAVDVPALRHLKDIVVFPSTGDRSVPSMLSGGDLDGDDYFVIWDPRLLPTEWNHPPMDFAPPTAVNCKARITDKDLKDFVIQFVQKDKLGQVAHAHLAWADREPQGVKSARCKLRLGLFKCCMLTGHLGLELATLHSIAVDYQKSGVPANLNHYHFPPSSPHFMEKKRSYRSTNSLGLIYDRIVDESLAFQPDVTTKFDCRVLQHLELRQEDLERARQIKTQYDLSMRRLMAQKHVDTEFEVFTGWAMSRPVVGSDYKRQEDLGRDFAAIKEHFCSLCESVAGCRGQDLDGFVAAMYAITQQQVQAYLHRLEVDECSVEDTDDSQYLSPPLISFPWLFAANLCRISCGDSYTPLKAKHGASRRHEMVLKTLKSAIADVVIA